MPTVRLVAGMLVAVAAVACGRPSAPPVLGTVPPFELVERSGDPYGSAQLAGRVWVVNFIFTTCPDICPALTAEMRALDRRLDPAERPQRVSISVDPTRDTPDVLRRYAERHGADAQWVFLTGERAAIASLLKDGFHVAFGDDGPPSQPITHSDRFVLVDAAMRIRGYYHGRMPEELDRLVADVRAVRAEAPAS
ncbi:MAG TPA: SCO family protein [Candidatus Limnocylindria bacterium]|nr:SCO family protein [Candidatus Limnocylindria bacterium]